MKTVCGAAKCTACMACADVCPKGAISVRVDVEYCNAEIDDAKCIDCHLCSKVCQVHNPVEVHGQIGWYQGWAKDNAIRAAASSGGLATAISKAFIRNGGLVYACVFENGKFGFIRIDSERDVDRMSGSKYVKSTPDGVYRQINASLKANDRVLMVGLPCQIAAAKNYVGKEMAHNFYAIDLICHGSPADVLLKDYLAQRGYQISSLEGVGFRTKNQYGLTTTRRPLNIPGVRDAYTIAFLNGMSYTENCYSCTYAQQSRVGDITLGDSWQSDLPEEEAAKGISLIMTQSQKGEELLHMTEIVLHDVNPDRAISANHQLAHPSVRPLKRDAFIAGLRAGRSLDALMFQCYPRQYVKQIVKKTLKSIRSR